MKRLVLRPLAEADVVRLLADRQDVAAILDNEAPSA